MKRKMVKIISAAAVSLLALGTMPYRTGAETPDTGETYEYGEENRDEKAAEYEFPYLQEEPEDILHIAESAEEETGTGGEAPDTGEEVPDTGEEEEPDAGEEEEPDAGEEEPDAGEEEPDAGEEEEPDAGEEEPDTGEEEPENPDAIPEAGFFMQDPATGIIIEAEAGVLPEGTLAVVTAMNGMEEAAALEQFMALSSDQFQIYNITFIDIYSMSVIQPQGDVKISIPVPEGYDTSRVVISSLTVNGEIPLRSELQTVIENGKAVATAGQTGILALMEKKILPQLPGKLDMTEKVEKLVLNPKYSASASLSPYTAYTSSAAKSPATGEEPGSYETGTAAAAAAAVSASVLLGYLRRKNNQTGI